MRHVTSSGIHLGAEISVRNLDPPGTGEGWDCPTGDLPVKSSTTSLVDSPFAWRCLWGAHIFMPSVFGSQGDDVCVNPMWASLTEHIGTWFFVVHIIPCFSVVYLIYTQGFTLFCCTILNLSKTHSSPNGTGLRSAGSRLRSFTVVPARFTGSRLAEMALQSAPDFWPGS